jgi:hypothetical protein
VADIATAWLRDAAGLQEPWVIFVSFVTPHYPLVAPKEFFDLYPVDQMPDPKCEMRSRFRISTASVVRRSALGRRAEPASPARGLCPPIWA